MWGRARPRADSGWFVRQLPSWKGQLFWRARLSLPVLLWLRVRLWEPVQPWPVQLSRGLLVWQLLLVLLRGRRLWVLRGLFSQQLSELPWLQALQPRLFWPVLWWLQAQLSWPVRLSWLGQPWVQVRPSSLRPWQQALLRLPSWLGLQPSRPQAWRRLWERPLQRVLPPFWLLASLLLWPLVWRQPALGLLRLFSREPLWRVPRFLSRGLPFWLPVFSQLPSGYLLGWVAKNVSVKAKGCRDDSVHRKPRLCNRHGAAER